MRTGIYGWNHSQCWQRLNSIASAHGNNSSRKTYERRDAVFPQTLPQLNCEHVAQRSYATQVKTASLLGPLAQAHPCTGQVVGTGSAGCTALPEGTGPAVASGHCSVPGRRWASGRARGSCTHRPMDGQHKAALYEAVGPGSYNHGRQCLPIHAAWDEVDRWEEAQWGSEQSKANDPEESNWRQCIALQQTSLRYHDLLLLRF